MQVNGNYITEEEIVELLPQVFKVRAYSLYYPNKIVSAAILSSLLLQLLLPTIMKAITILVMIIILLLLLLLLQLPLLLINARVILFSRPASKRRFQQPSSSLPQQYHFCILPSNDVNRW